MARSGVIDHLTPAFPRRPWTRSIARPRGSPPRLQPGELPPIATTQGDGFASAVAFIVRIGFDAEAADHHPDILLSNYKKVTLTFTTHSEGGLTGKDFAGAEAADRVFGSR